VETIKEWLPGALGLLLAAIGYQLRNWVNSLRDPDLRERRSSEREQKAWLTSEERRVRESVNSTTEENKDLRARVHSLEKEVAAERKSGMDHYSKTVRLYDYVVKLIHDWRNGNEPPDHTPDFDKI
jgi:cell division protein FtsB